MKPRLTPKRIEGLKAVLKILEREDIQAGPNLSADLSRARDYLADLVEDWEFHHAEERNGRRVYGGKVWRFDNKSLWWVRSD